MANNSLILKHKNRRRYKSEHSKPDPQLPGRNDKCPCGSGKKFKACHLLINRQEEEAAWARAKQRADEAFEKSKKDREETIALGKSAAPPMFGRSGGMPLMLAAAALAMGGFGGLGAPRKGRRVF